MRALKGRFARACQLRCNHGAQRRQHFGLETRMLRHPQPRSPCGVGEGDEGQILAEAGDPFGEREALQLRQIARLGMDADQQGQAVLRQHAEHRVMPLRGALLARRCVSPGGAAGIAEAHRHLRHEALVIECRLVDPQPVAQPVAAVIVPRHATGVDPGAGCLSDDEDARRGGKTRDRARAERQVARAQGAGGDPALEVRDGVVWPPAGAAHPSTISASISQRSSAASFSARALAMP